MRGSLKLVAATMLMLATSAGSAWADDYYGDDCRHENRGAGTILGAIAGGLIGGAASHGNGGAVVGGVILGGLAGNAIAGNIDCEDRPYAYRTYRESFDGDIGERYEWHHHNNHGYIVTHRQYWRGDELCRDFTVVTWHHGEEYDRDGTACRDEDDDWRFMDDRY